MSGGDLGTVLGTRYPVIQAPIGSASSARLAAAVSEAGALGSLAVSWSEPPAVRRVVRAAHALTNRPIAANFVLHWDMRERLDTCLDEGVRIISLFWGDPAPYVELAHSAGAVVLHTVGSVDEARRAVDAGVDVIIAQGWEAGGHVRGHVTSLVLVPAVVDAVGDVPVVAAGGIADGRGLVAALALGAAGVMIGSRFLLAEEANTHSVYRAALVSAGVQDTVHTTAFDGGWPDAPHRVLRNSTVRRWEAAGSPPAGARPGEGEVVACRGGSPIVRYHDDIATAETTGTVEELAQYAGQAVGLVHRVEPASAIVESIVCQAGHVKQAVLAQTPARRDEAGD